jgi:DNA-binding transcriptional LysR family regulator
MELHALDLNLLVVFDQLMRQRQVSRAAEQLGVTQPAVSNALARLRRHLGDPLFVRTAAGMQPTPRAQALAAPVAEALAQLRAALSQRDDFTPATSTRQFRIGMTDIGEIYFLPWLLRTLAERAPGVTLSTVRNTAVNLAEELAAGQVDLAIGLLPQLKGGFFKRQLFNQRYVCLMRRGHPLARRTLDSAGYLGAEHVVVVSPGTGHGQVDEGLRRQGLARRVRLTVPHFVAIGHLLADTDLLATVPERLAESLATPFGLVARPMPIALPEAAISVFWHARQHKDAANRWLRGLAFERFGAA